MEGDSRLFPDIEDKSLDPDKVKDYLEAISPELKEFAKMIFDNTRYIPFSEFHSTMESHLKETLGKLSTPYYLLLDKTSVSSTHWLFLLFEEIIINDFNFLGIMDLSDVMDTEITEVLNLVFFDDMIYSGNSIMAYLDNLTYGTDNLKGDIHIDIIVGYCGNLGRKAIEKQGPRMMKSNFYLRNKTSKQKASCVIHSAEDIDTILDIFKKNEIPYPRNMEYFGDRHFTCPVYFDHKLAGTMSSIPSIYAKGIVPKYEGDIGKTDKRYNCNPDKKFKIKLGPMIKKIPVTDGYKAETKKVLKEKYPELVNIE